MAQVDLARFLYRGHPFVWDVLGSCKDGHRVQVSSLEGIIGVLVWVWDLAQPDPVMAQPVGHGTGSCSTWIVIVVDHYQIITLGK